MCWVFMEEYPATLDLHMVYADHELHVFFSLLQVHPLFVRVGIQALKLTEWCAGRTADHQKRPLPKHPRPRPAAMAQEAEIPSHPILIFENSFSLKDASLKDPSMSKENGSIECFPQTASRNIDISPGVFAKHPGVLNKGNCSSILMILFSGIKPGVGLNP